MVNTWKAQGGDGEDGADEDGEGNRDDGEPEGIAQVAKGFPLPLMFPILMLLVRPLLGGEHANGQGQENHEGDVVDGEQFKTASTDQPTKKGERVHLAIDMQNSCGRNAHLLNYSSKT
jgi:hypothetical protein